jgi:hypothetical protein
MCHTLQATYNALVAQAPTYDYASAPQDVAISVLPPLLDLYYTGNSSWLSPKQLNASTAALRRIVSKLTIASYGLQWIDRAAYGTSSPEPYTDVVLNSWASWLVNAVDVGDLGAVSAAGPARWLQHE